MDVTLTSQDLDDCKDAGVDPATIFEQKMQEIRNFAKHNRDVAFIEKFKSLAEKDKADIAAQVDAKAPKSDGKAQ